MGRGRGRKLAATKWPRVFQEGKQCNLGLVSLRVNLVLFNGTSVQISVYSIAALGA